jgi:hypothetical protein
MEGERDKEIEGDCKSAIMMTEYGTQGRWKGSEDTRKDSRGKMWFSYG